MWLLELPQMMVARFQAWASLKHQALNGSLKNHSLKNQAITSALVTHNPPRFKGTEYRPGLLMGEGVSRLPGQTCGMEDATIFGKCNLPHSPFPLESMRRCTFSAQLDFMLSAKTSLSWGLCYHEEWASLSFFSILTAPIPRRSWDLLWGEKATSLSITNIPWTVSNHQLHIDLGCPLPPDCFPSPHLVQCLWRTRWTFLLIIVNRSESKG